MTKRDAFQSNKNKLFDVREEFPSAKLNSSRCISHDADDENTNGLLIKTIISFLSIIYFYSISMTQSNFEMYTVPKNFKWNISNSLHHFQIQLRWICNILSGVSMCERALHIVWLRRRMRHWMILLMSKTWLITSLSWFGGVKEGGF